MRNFFLYLFTGLFVGLFIIKPTLIVWFNAILIISIYTLTLILYYITEICRNFKTKEENV